MPALLLVWLESAPLLFVGAIVLGLMSLAVAIGCWVRKRMDKADAPARDGKRDNGPEGYLVSATLGLLALLMGFTFSLAIERFETRRVLVLADANAIGTAYLRVQLLDEPHPRLSGLLINLASNNLKLAALSPQKAGPLLAEDRILTDIWSATAAAFDSIKHYEFSNALLESINSMIDLAASRRAARTAHVPAVVLAVLLFYLVRNVRWSWALLLAGNVHWLLPGSLLVLLTLSLGLLIIDIDRPTIGGIRESQGPMEQLLKSLKSQPPTVYDRWRTAAAPH